MYKTAALTACLASLAAALQLPTRRQFGIGVGTAAVVPPALAAGGKAVFLSDFMGPREEIFPALIHAAERGVSGAYVQIVDPAEESFPFDGRTVFRSMGGTITHETLKAGDLRSRYTERLAERRERLRMLARQAGWQFDVHHTDASAQAALLWLYRATERVR